MATFLDSKLAAFQAAQRDKGRARMAAIAAIALFAAARATGSTWLAGPGLLALVAALVLRVRAARALTRVGDSQGSGSEADSNDTRHKEPLTNPHSGQPESIPSTLEHEVLLELELNEPVALKTDTGKATVLPAGSYETALRLSFAQQRPQESDAIDYPRCSFRLRDSEGASWQTSSYLDPSALTRPIELGDRDICFWDQAPRHWKETLQSHCLIAGVRQLLDSRDRYELRIGDQPIIMMLKYQGPILDVAWLESENKFLVRASSMYYEVWKDDELEDIVDQVSFGYLVEIRELLPITSPQSHWRNWQAWEEDESPCELVFKKTET